MNRPRMSFWQIWNMSFGFLGIQFGWGLQLANMSPIYKYLHAEESSLPYLWLAGPITGLLIQPIIGSMSDRTWNRLGRRRPFFLTGVILSSLALVLMPSSGTLWIAAGILWIMDASINVSMEPFRAFVADALEGAGEVGLFEDCAGFEVVQKNALRIRVPAQLCGGGSAVQALGESPGDGEAFLRQAHRGVQQFFPGFAASLVCATRAHPCFPKLEHPRLYYDL